MSPSRETAARIVLSWADSGRHPLARDVRAALANRGHWLAETTEPDAEKVSKLLCSADLFVQFNHAPCFQTSWMAVDLYSAVGKLREQGRPRILAVRSRSQKPPRLFQGAEPFLVVVPPNVEAVVRAVEREVGLAGTEGRTAMKSPDLWYRQEG